MPVNVAPFSVNLPILLVKELTINLIDKTDKHISHCNSMYRTRLQYNQYFLFTSLCVISLP